VSEVRVKLGQESITMDYMSFGLFLSYRALYMKLANPKFSFLVHTANTYRSLAKTIFPPAVFQRCFETREREVDFFLLPYVVEQLNTKVA